VVEGRIVLVGDAAGHISPLMGMGFATSAGSHSPSWAREALLIEAEKSFYKRLRLENLC